MKIVDICGWIGLVGILLAYFLVSYEKVLPTSKTYQTINLIGSLALIINAIAYKTIPIAILNLIWFIIALVGLIKIIKKGQ